MSNRLCLWEKLISRRILKFYNRLQVNPNKKERVVN